MALSAKIPVRNLLEGNLTCSRSRFFASKTISSTDSISPESDRFFNGHDVQLQGDDIVAFGVHWKSLGPDQLPVPHLPEPPEVWQNPHVPP